MALTRTCFMQKAQGLPSGMQLRMTLTDRSVAIFATAIKTAANHYTWPARPESKTDTMWNRFSVDSAPAFLFPETHP